MNQYFISDTHFCHKNIIKFYRHPYFSNVTQMNDAIIQQWNATVKSQNDVVYHLGDVAFYKKSKPEILQEILPNLKGRKILILGNHDDPSHLAPFFEEIHQLLEIPNFHYNTYPQVKKITLCHYSMITWNKSYRSEHIHLFGHSHGTLTPPPGIRSMDVGVDSPHGRSPGNYAPLTIDQIINFIYNKPISGDTPHAE